MQAAGLSSIGWNGGRKMPWRRWIWVMPASGTVSRYCARPAHAPQADIHGGRHAAEAPADATRSAAPAADHAHADQAGGQQRKAGWLRHAVRNGAGFEEGRQVRRATRRTEALAQLEDFLFRQQIGAMRQRLRDIVRITHGILGNDDFRNVVQRGVAALAFIEPDLD